MDGSQIVGIVILTGIILYVIRAKNPDSTEVSPSEVTPAPSRFTSVGTRMTPSESKTDLDCLVLTVILFVL